MAEEELMAEEETKEIGEEPPREPLLSNAEEWIEGGARIGLGLLAIAALVLAALESHEAIGTALVGAAIAFGLGAAFFERLEEVSTKGAKLARRLRREVERKAPDASPDEREELFEESAEIAEERRAKGESVSPELAVGEARLASQKRHLGAQASFANWLLEGDWSVPRLDALTGLGPDLLAVKDDRAIAVEVKAGVRPAGRDAVEQAGQIARRSEPLVAPRPIRAVLAVGGGMGLTRAAAVLAEETGTSVYAIGGSHREVSHLAGPELD